MGITFQPKLNDTYQVSGNIIERNEEYQKIKSLKLKNLITNDDLECTFNPKIFTDKRNNDEEDSLNIGERLYSYHQKYQQRKENIKEMYTESFPFKPELSKNTDTILRNREIALEQIRKKFPAIKTQSYDCIEEVEEDSYEPKAQIDQNLKKYAQKVEKMLESKSTIDLVHPLASGRDNIKPTKAIRPIADSKLLDMANQYITTDESLDRFQTQVNEKNKKFNILKEEYVRNVNTTLKSKINTGNIFNTLIEEKKHKANIESTMKIPKNVARALEYYNFLES